MLKAKDRFALIAIAKNELPYIEEWISYHFALGVDDIFIYDNSLTGELLYLGNESITVIPWNIEMNDNKQRLAYQESFARTINHAYCSFIDIDEFICLRLHDNLKSFCEEHVGKRSLVLNWAMFGCNGHETRTPGGVLERFVRRNRLLDRCYKTISYRPYLHYQCIHASYGDGDFMYNIEGKVVRDEKSVPALSQDSVACINHYVTKSIEEYHARNNMGRVSTSSRAENYPLDLFKDEIEDLDALNFYNKNCLTS